MTDNYTSARKRFDQTIEVGDRVALAPHLDLWMAGTRYGTCIETRTMESTIYLIEFDHRNRAWLGADDLLGALH